MSANGLSAAAEAIPDYEGLTEERSGVLHRHMPCEVRALNDEKREATFVAATETPVAIDRFGTREVLRMHGVRLGRFRANPVVLDSHDRFNLESVIGSATVKREGRELVATVRYANTASGQNAWALVRDGHVRAVSVGYAINPDKVRFLAEGEADGEEEARVEGPALVVREWTLLEISNVAIPADQHALRRSFYAEHFPLNEKEKPMADSVYGKAQGTAEGQRQEAPAAAPESGRQEKRAENVTPFPREIEEEVAARREKARVEHIRTLCPEGLEDVATEAILNGYTVEKARKRLLEEHAERAKPVGTPEPEPATRTQDQQDTPSEDEYELAVRSLFGRA